jgi:hypothetical protein
VLPFKVLTLIDHGTVLPQSASFVAPERLHYWLALYTGIASSKLGPLFAGLCLILYTPLRASPGYCGDSGATVARKRSLSNSYADTLLKDGSHRVSARLQPRLRSATSKFQELG